MKNQTMKAMKNNQLKGILVALIAILCMDAEAQTTEMDSLMQAVSVQTDSLLMAQQQPWTMTGVVRGYAACCDKVAPDRLTAERMKAALVIDMMKGSMEPMDSAVDIVLPQIATDSLRTKIRDAQVMQVKTFGHLFPGQPAPDLGFTDRDGKHHTLSEMKGKVLFVDIWGTWCVPCIEEFPHLRELNEHFKDRGDVVIMSIACDKQADRWQRFLMRRGKEMPWQQYLIDAESKDRLDKVYFVVGIPRFFIIDRQGCIVLPDAPRPSEGTVAAMLEKL